MALHEPLFYDSQAAGAAALNIDVYVLRDAKREGCPAFRSGRVYRRELIERFQEKKPHVLNKCRSTERGFPIRTGQCRRLSEEIASRGWLLRKRRNPKAK
jgi:hypothetical protein